MNHSQPLRSALARAVTLGQASTALVAIALGLTLAVSAPVALAEPAQTAASTSATHTVSGHYDNIAYIAREQRIMADWTRLTSLPDSATAGNPANVKRAAIDPAPHTTQADPPTTAYIARWQRIMADWTRLTSIPETVTTGNAASR